MLDIMNIEVARSIPLADVLLATGCRPDRGDKNNWKTPVGRLTVSGLKFYCHDLARGGGGAIDLVMMIRQTDFKGALEWLSYEIGTVNADQKPRAILNQRTRTPSIIPAPVDDHWPRVRNYLISTRCLSEGLVDQLHFEGRIYSDQHANAVFLLENGQGAELRGTRQRKFHGARGKKAPFKIITNGPLKVAFVEAAIDAISLRCLGFAGEIVSLTGNASEISKELAGKYRVRGYLVFAAFDSDKAGDLMAQQLGQPAVRLRPPIGNKDWNDVLRIKMQILFP